MKNKYLNPIIKITFVALLFSCSINRNPVFRGQKRFSELGQTSTIPPIQKIRNKFARINSDKECTRKRGDGVTISEDVIVEYQKEFASSFYNSYKKWRENGKESDYQKALNQANFHFIIPQHEQWVKVLKILFINLDLQKHNPTLSSKIFELITCLLKQRCRPDKRVLEKLLTSPIEIRCGRD